MARSDYIYLVRSGDLLNAGAVPVIAFTVKREMRTWLSHREPEVLGTLSVFRMRDGREGATEMSIPEILSEGEAR